MTERSMHRLEGGCHCGNIRVAVELPNIAGDYHPRACDCDFCRKHGASYVSDPYGSFRIEVENSQFLGRYRQGNAIVDCIFCTRCGVLVGVLYQENDRLYATVNSAALNGNDRFGAKKVVSPKLLAPSEKVSRWKDLWFANVTLVTAGA